MNGTIGEIRLWAGSWAPQKWLFCEGQLLQLSNNFQYHALATVIGNTFGGDFGGDNDTIALPDLRGKLPVRSIICVEGDYPMQP